MLQIICQVLSSTGKRDTARGTCLSEFCNIINLECTFVIILQKGISWGNATKRSCFIPLIAVLIIFLQFSYLLYVNNLNPGVLND